MAKTKKELEAELASSCLKVVGLNKVIKEMEGLDEEFGERLSETAKSLSNGIATEVMIWALHHASGDITIEQCRSLISRLQEISGAAFDHVKQG